jgi:predicted P-loop ATPase
MSAKQSDSTDWLPAQGAEALGSIAQGWKTRLITTSKGKPAACLENALVALRHAQEWQGVLHFNESSMQVTAKSEPPWDSRALPFIWRDDDDVRAAAWMQRQGIMVGQEVCGQAIQTIARERGFHPIRDYLASLTWDGIRRIDDWLTLYLGVDPTDYVRAVGAKWLIGAVARVYKPGCKNDSCLILEGPQGSLKSTALRTLADPWFTDDMPELGTKDSALQTRGVWIVELAELDAMSRAEVSKVKAFMSRATDRFRPPYGRHPIEAPRECVFAGTVNHDAYLRDETGGRRFWPVRCGKIDITDLGRDRDQLWAEARERFRAGERWWLDSTKLNEAAAVEQQERFDADAWQPIIELWIEGREDVTVEQILADCLKKQAKDWAQPDKSRVARSLKALKWERFQKRLDDGSRQWRYRKSPLSPLAGANR